MLLFIGVLFLLSIIGLIYSLVQNANFYHENTLQIKTQQGDLLAITSASVDRKIGTISQQINDYAKQISQNEVRVETLGSSINHDFRVRDDNILGLGVVYLDPRKKLKSQRLYWTLQNYRLVATSYNKTIDDETRWVSKALSKPQRWTRPYYDASLKQYVISYITTFYDSKTNRAAGFIILDLDLKSLVNLVAQNIGERFTSIVTDSGDYIYTSDPRKIVMRTNFSKGSDSDSQIDQQVFNYNKAKPCLSLCHNTVIKYEEVYVIYQQLKNVPWLIMAKFNPKELESLSRATDNSNLMLKIASTTLLIICSGLALIIILMTRKNQYKFYWIATAFVSCCCVISTVYTWSVSRNLYFIDTSQAITSDHFMQGMLKKYQSEATLKNLGAITEIPTAVLVDSVEFLTAYNLQLTGTIMQSYPKESSIEPGLKFNNAFDSKITLTSDTYINNTHLLIWSFQTKIRENFDYAEFPFNHGKIWLSISPLNSNSKILFTPNFTYYNGLTDINANYGVNPNIIIPGWLIKGSFFSFTNDNSRMLDDLDSYTTVHLPALTFNMMVNSTISDAIITTITPPIVIILILFMILLTISKHKNRFIEFKISTIIGSCSGILFTVVFTHVSLRNKLTSEIMYIEYIYLLMYIIIIMIPVNGFLFAKTKLRFIHYGNNLIFKTLFLLLITSFIFIMTLLSFS